MELDDRKLAGLLLFTGGLETVFGIILAEIFYPGYSTSHNYISDLGVGPSAIIFNSSMVLLGVLVLGAAYYLRRVYDLRLFYILLAITGVGAIGVGLFTEDAGVLHTIFSLVTFLFAGLSAILSIKLQKPPLSFLSLILGAFSLLALLLFATGTYLGLGKGGMERMIAYPVLLWVIGFSGQLMGSMDARDNA
jgi:hypothetical membrane protein